MANFNFNKVILGGRLTETPELKTTPGGVSVTTFSMAVNRKYNKDQQQQTDFINCVAWRGTAEFINRYFTKGSSICVTGAIQTRNWTDDKGNKRYATEVIVDEANFVDSKSDNTTGYNDNAPSYSIDSTNFEELPNDETLPF